MILAEILKFRFSVHIVKDDWPPLTAKDLTRYFKFEIKSAHGQRWLTPPWLPMILPEILKFRFSLHIVKDDWPPHPLDYQI